MHIFNSTLSALPNLTSPIIGQFTVVDSLILGGIGVTAILLANPDLKQGISNLRQRISKFIADKKLRTSISKIDALIADGKKVCLFIGRMPKEKLPSETGEAKEDEIWVSGDIGDEGSADHPEKVHLHADFNQDELTPLLSRKFSRIVIDLSVKKFLGNDFTKRFRQMLRDSTSELIFPADGAYCVYKNPEYYPEIGDKEFIYCVASDIFYLNLKHSKEIQTELLGKVRLKEMECQLNALFNRVIYINEGNYPYKFGWTGSEEYKFVQESYFILSNPKLT